MSNIFWKAKTYKLFNGEQEVGFFTVDLNKIGDYEYDLKFHKKEYEPWSFSLANSFNNYSKAFIKSWVEERVFPRERENIREILDQLGIEEYDQFLILKARSGRGGMDRLWIDFVSFVNEI